ncbi:hypothetical protein SWI_01628, partial [Staphylococcus aureus M0045]|uniref:hypothetical protein n=1 Tax=Staphylococcus aureus TaxID=1280 RepID=UPI0002C96DA8
MAKSCLHILTNNEYATTRCQDGIVLFWPIDGEIELQKFRKSKIIEDDIYIINHLDVFSIKNNKKTIMLYLRISVHIFINADLIVYKSVLVILTNYKKLYFVT